MSDGTLGYQKRDINDSYMVTITDKRPHSAAPAVKTDEDSGQIVTIVRAPLQGNIEFSTDSEWSPLSVSYLNSVMEEAFQVITQGRTPVNRWNTRRIWKGCSPITFTLNLKFEAETDAEKEVFSPLRELQRMCLPYVGEKAVGQFFLHQPGPLAFDFGSTFGDPGNDSEVITVDIGRFMSVTNCVVTKVSPTVARKFSADGKPMEVVVSFTFQTYSIISKESLDGDLFKGKALELKNALEEYYKKASEFYQKKVAPPIKETVEGFKKSNDTLRENRVNYSNPVSYMTGT